MINLKNKSAVLTLAAVLSTSIISESWAETIYDYILDGTNKCGENCTWKIEGDTITISGTGEMYDFGYYDYTPWYNDSAYNNVTKVVVDKGITSVGSYAFTYKEIENLSLPDSLKHVGGEAFNVSSVVIPDTLEKFEWSAFGTNNIICKGDIKKCENIKVTGNLDTGDLVDYVGLATELPNGNVLYNGVEYGWREKYIEFEEPLSKFSKMTITSATKEQCTGEYAWNETASTCNRMTEEQGQGDSQESEQQESQVPGSATSAADCAASGKYWQEGKCVSSCGASFRLNDGWCDRQRYTPAEAAKVLKNDNTNEVTITFKK